MFAEDYRELKIENADNIASRCFLFEKFVDDLLEQQPGAIRFNTRAANVAIHPHCHAKSILDPEFMASLAERLPGRKATVLDTACCGMAGAFGALAEKYDLSVQVAQRLLDPRHRSHRLRHKLPPSNHRPNESPAKTYGRVTLRSTPVVAVVSAASNFTEKQLSRRGVVRFQKADLPKNFRLPSRLTNYRPGL